EDININIKKLSKQVICECIYPTDNNNNNLFGPVSERDVNFCYGLSSRITNLVTTKIYDRSFDFNDTQKKETNLIEIIEGFLSDKQQKNFVLRIGFESLGYEFQAREILANAIGKYLLKLARNQKFKENPIVLVLDEAHQFLNKAIVDDYFQSTSLTAFDQIAKESRKYGLFLCIS
ncbi:hypothetical protein, partial [Enterococcus faecalis]